VDMLSYLIRCVTNRSIPAARIVFRFYAVWYSILEGIIVTC